MTSIAKMADDLCAFEYTDRIERLNLPVKDLPAADSHYREIFDTVETNMKSAATVLQVARKAWRNKTSAFENVYYDEAAAHEFLEWAKELHYCHAEVGLVAEELRQALYDYAVERANEDEVGATPEAYETIRTAVSDLLIVDAHAATALLQFA